MDSLRKMQKTVATALDIPAQQEPDGATEATEARKRRVSLPAAFWELAPLLDVLPAGTNVAVVTLLGSLCPVTLAHVRGLLEVRRLLLAEPGCRRPAKLEDFGEVLGFVSLNGDGHVGHKLAAQGQRALDRDQRRHLVSLATQEYPWIQQERNEGESLRRLKSQWPQLKFIHFCMNGADDVVKYGKYSWSSRSSRFITMGRPGYTEDVVEGMRNSGVDEEAGYFILGPELEDVSSSAVREALVQGNAAALRGLLDERVAGWCIANYRA